MTFRHATELWNEHPDLVAGVLHVEGVDGVAEVSAHVERLSEVARARFGLTPRQWRLCHRALA